MYIFIKKSVGKLFRGDVGSNYYFHGLLNFFALLSKAYFSRLMPNCLSTSLRLKKSQRTELSKVLRPQPWVWPFECEKTMWELGSNLNALPQLDQFIGKVFRKRFLCLQGSSLYLETGGLAHHLDLQHQHILVTIMDFGNWSFYICTTILSFLVS